MNWLLETLTEPSMIQAVAVISIVAAVGVYLGRLKIFGISLGITFVFFAGIMAGHLGITVNKDMLNFAQNFGLIVFVYTLGLQVGPGFFSSLKKGGVEMNTMGLGVIALGLILTLVFHWITGISVPVMVGLLSGAVTNTPALGAAQQALLQMDPENTRNVTDMALACAVAYPLGVVGVILAIIILRSLFAKKTQSTHKEQDTTTNVAEFQVLNPSIYNKSIQQVMKLTEKHFVISRLWRNGKVTIPTSETILKEKDHLLIISVKADVESIKVLFGEQETTDWNKEDIDWNAIDSQLISRRIVVTRNRVNGVKLGSLRLRNLYGINITRVNRAGIDLVASRDLRLQIGDKLTIVGEANSVNNVGKILGDELKRLDNPNLLAIFVGLTLGVLIGAIPIAIRKSSGCNRPWKSRTSTLIPRSSLYFEALLNKARIKRFLIKKNAYIHFLPPVLNRIMRKTLKGIGKGRRVGKLSFLEKLCLPHSFAFSAVSGVVPSPFFVVAS